MAVPVKPAARLASLLLLAACAPGPSLAPATVTPQGPCRADERQAVRQAFVLSQAERGSVKITMVVSATDSDIELGRATASFRNEEKPKEKKAIAVTLDEDPGAVSLSCAFSVR